MNQFFQNLKGKTSRLMEGRYGMDPFSAFLSKAALVLLILSRIRIFSFLYVWGLACMFYGIYRMMSRKFDKRRAENQLYLQYNYKFRTQLAEYKNRLQSRQDYKYFKCKQCKKLLRVPRGRGKLNVTCPQCGHKMIQKS